MKKLTGIGELIRTQDDTNTEIPIFIVQKRVRTYGYLKIFADNYTWINSSTQNEATYEESEMLERATYLFGSEFMKVYYQEQWVFETACFTHKACEKYIEVNLRRLGKARINIVSGFYNPEWKTIRAYLLSITDK